MKAMNDIFNFKRFGLYLASDIKSAAHSCSVSVILLGFSGILADFILAFCAFVLEGEWVMPGNTVRFFLFVIFLLVACIIIPIKCYGYVTDSNRGPAFAMLPVSAAEKSASMILVAGVAAPLLVVILYFATDALATALFPEMGQPLLSSKGFLLNQILGDMAQAHSSSVEYTREFSSFVSYFLGYGWQAVKFCTTALYFLLGAIVFKKQKGAKSIAVLLILSFVLSGVATPLFVGNDMSSLLDGTPEQPASFFKALRISVEVLTIVLPLLLCGGIFYRVKSIKY